MAQHQLQQLQQQQQQRNEGASAAHPAPSNTNATAHASGANANAATQEPNFYRQNTTSGSQRRIQPVIREDQEYNENEQDEFAFAEGVPDKYGYVHPHPMTASGGFGGFGPSDQELSRTSVEGGGGAGARRMSALQKQGSDMNFLGVLPT